MYEDKSVITPLALLPLPYFQAAKLQSHPVADLCGVLVHVVTPYLRANTHKYIFQKACSSTDQASKAGFDRFL